MNPSWNKAMTYTMSVYSLFIVAVEVEVRGKLRSGISRSNIMQKLMQKYRSLHSRHVIHIQILMFT